VMRFTALFAEEFPVSSQSVWRYLNVNQARSEQDKNWQAAQQKMREVIEKPLREVLHDNSIELKERLSLFQYMQDFFTEMSPDSPYERMKVGQQFLEAAKAIENKVHFFLSLYKKLSQSKKASPFLLEKIHQKILESYVKTRDDEGLDFEALLEKRLNECVNKDDISATLPLARKDYGEVEVEAEQEQQIQLEQEVEQQSDVIKEKKYYPLASSLQQFFDPPFFSPIHSIKKVLPSAVHKLLKDHVEHVSYSRNLFIDNYTLGSSHHGDYHLNSRYMLVIEDKRRKPPTKKFVFISCKDAEEVKKMMQDQKIDIGTLTLMTLNGSFVQTSGGDDTIPSLQNDPELKKALLLGKLTTGKVNFSKQETEELEELLLPSSLGPQRQKARATLKKFYEDILKFHPASFKSYKLSLVRRMLAKKEEAVADQESEKR
jgi:hypothetical protein